MSRRRFRWDNETQSLVEVEPDFTGGHTPSMGAPVVDLYMDGTRAPDGTDIGSRAKRRAYMKAHNLADADDYKGTWEKAAKEREAIRSGTAGREERREAIARALYTGRNKR